MAIANHVKMKFLAVAVAALCSSGAWAQVSGTVAGGSGGGGEVLNGDTVTIDPVTINNVDITYDDGAGTTAGLTNGSLSFIDPAGASTTVSNGIISFDDGAGATTTLLNQSFSIDDGTGQTVAIDQTGMSVTGTGNVSIGSAGTISASGRIDGGVYGGQGGLTSNTMTLTNGGTTFADPTNGTTLSVTSGAAATLGNGTLAGSLRISDGTGTNHTVLDGVNNSITGTTNTVTGGNGQLSVANNAASLGVTAGGNFAATDTAATTSFGANNVVVDATGVAVTGATSITGATTIVGATSVTGATTINTAGVEATTIGANGNTTSIDSSTVNVGTGAYATTVAIGGADVGTTVNATAGNSTLVMDNAGVALSGAVASMSGTTSATVSGGATTLTLDNNGATLNNMQLKGLADGTDPTDAVTVRQLSGLTDRAYAGIASVAALAAIPTPPSGKRFTIGAGVGNYAGQHAFALGFRGAVTDQVSVTLGLSHNSASKTAANAGVGFSW